MSKADKRENIIMVDRAVVFSTCRCNDRLSFRSPVSHSRLKEVQFLPGNNLNSSQFFLHSGLDGDQDKPHGGDHAKNESTPNSHHRPVLCASVGSQCICTHDRIRTGKGVAQSSQEYSCC
jgi:hypothetical protein